MKKKQQRLILRKRNNRYHSTIMTIKSFNIQQVEKPMADFEEIVTEI